MGDIRNVGFKMSQNKMVSLVWGLCTANHWERVVHYDNAYKIEKGLRWSIYSIIESVWVYVCTHWWFSVCFPVKSHFTSLQDIYYLLSNGSMPKTLWTTLCVEDSFAPTLVLQFVNCDVISNIIHSKQEYLSCWYGQCMYNACTESY